MIATIKSLSKHRKPEFKIAMLQPEVGPELYTIVREGVYQVGEHVQVFLPGENNGDHVVRAREVHGLYSECEIEPMAVPEHFAVPDPEVAREVFAAASDLAQATLLVCRANYGAPESLRAAATRVVELLFKAAHSSPRTRTCVETSEKDRADAMGEGEMAADMAVLRSVLVEAILERESAHRCQDRAELRLVTVSEERDAAVARISELEMERNEFKVRAEGAESACIQWEENARRGGEHVAHTRGLLSGKVRP